MTDWLNGCAVIAGTADESARSTLAHPRLYPALVTDRSEEELQPFTDQQLRTLYYNNELEHCDEFVDVFLQVSCTVGILLQVIYHHYALFLYHVYIGYSINVFFPGYIVSETVGI